MRAETQLLFIALAACATTPTPRSTVSTEQNKNVVRRIFEEALNQGRMDTLDALVAPEFVGPGGQKGAASFAAVLSRLKPAFPDIHYTIEQLIAEDDAVAVRWTWTGTQTGAYFSIPATHKTFTNPGFAVFKLREGKLVSMTMDTDRLGFLLQIGVVSPSVIPQPPSPTAR